MNGIDTAQICLKGHLITEYFETFEIERFDYCKDCGAKTITACPECNAKIPGKIDGKDFSGVPSHCSYCGAPYPWTALAIESMRSIIQESDDLSDELKSTAHELVPDLLLENPKTPHAVLIFKKVLLTLGKTTSNMLLKNIIDYGCEFVKQNFLP